MKISNIVGFLLLFAGVIEASSLYAVGNGAVMEVKAILKRSGIKLGVDRDRDRYVFIGTCEKEVADPANNEKFSEVRDDCAKIAELAAKRDLMKARYIKATLHDSVEAGSVDGKAVVFTKSLCKYVSEASHTGSTVLCSAESWDDESKVYQVAVAVAWSKKLEESGTKHLQATMPTGDAVDDDPEWERWVKSVNLASVFGSRQFLDSSGARRYVGIGSMEIDGKRGKALKDAYTVAKRRAVSNLAFAVYSDAVSVDVAKTVLAQMQEGKLEETDAWESFTSEVLRKCKNKIVRGHEVYDSEDFVNPISGKSIYITVYGIEKSQVR